MKSLNKKRIILKMLVKQEAVGLGFQLNQWSQICMAQLRIFNLFLEMNLKYLKLLIDR